MENIIISVILITILGLVTLYIIKEKKKGRKCIGCPDSKTCPHAKNGGCSIENK